MVVYISFPCMWDKLSLHVSYIDFAYMLCMYVDKQQNNFKIFILHVQIRVIVKNCVIVIITPVDATFLACTDRKSFTCVIVCVFTEKRHDRSMWTYIDMGPMYKAMFVSNCIFVVIFLAFCGIYFAVGRRKHAVVSYYCSNSKLTAEFPCYF